MSRWAMVRFSYVYNIGALKKDAIVIWGQLLRGRRIRARRIPYIGIPAWYCIGEHVGQGRKLNMTSCSHSGSVTLRSVRVGAQPLLSVAVCVLLSKVQ